MKKSLPGILFFLILCFSTLCGYTQHANLGLTSTNTACGACVYVTGPATFPVSYLWDNGSFTQCINGVTPGVYFVTVTDANGFWDTLTVNTISIAPVYVTLATTGISTCPCYIIGLTSGAGPYTYSLNGISGNTANPLCELVPGQYYIQVMDANGCTADTFLNVPASALYLLGTVTPALCRNGTATITAYNGTPPYTYLWNTVPPQTDSVAVGLQANNTYTITVTDDSGCTQTQQYFIHTTSNLSSGISMIPDTCGHASGTLTAYGLSGFPPYRYHWNTNDSVASLTNQTSGHYSVTVTDDSGCVSVSSDFLSNYSPVLVSSSIVQPSCTSFTGSVTLTPTGGTVPYNYFWSTVPVQTTNVASGLATGYYTCLVTDQQGCTADIGALVTDSSSFRVSAVAVNDTCGLGTGKVIVSTTNGVAPFTYQWNSLPPDTNHMLPNLHARHVECIVTDQALCVRKATAYVNYYSPMHVNVTPHNAACIFDSTGWAEATVTGGTSPLTFAWTGDTSHVKSNLYPGSYSCYVTDSMGCTSYRIFQIGYDAVLPCAVTIEGTVINDTNANCLKDPGDISLSRVLVGCEPNGGFHSTDNFGRYSFFLPPGNYRVWQPQLPPWHVAVCPAVDYYDTLPVVGMKDTNNFANIGHAMDLDINCFSVIPPRPGFTYTQSVYYRNQGTTVVPNAVLKIQHDSLITFAQSIPPAANYDAANRILTWNLPSLNPFGTYSASQGQVVIHYLVPPTVTLGTPLHFADTIFPVTGDTVVFNNYESCTEVVVGSFDPNDISVDPKGIGSQGLITQDDSLLTYLIRFQNTGNYPAQNVVIKTPLDGDLDWSSFQAEGASFTYTVDISATGMATISFLNIYLPDSTFDEPRSHGYFAFSIRQNTGLLSGTEIPASAGIIFDFNAPVQTNLVLNTIYDPLGLNGPGNEPVPIVAYPNPTTGKLVVQVTLKKSGFVITEVLDVLGQRLLLQNKFFAVGVQRTELDLSAFLPGIYFIRVNSGDVNNVLKITKF